jgi:outer membrane protein assembly factor BamB
VNTNNDSVIALELATGKVRWQFAPPEGPSWGNYVSSPIILGDKGLFSGRNAVGVRAECRRRQDHMATANQCQAHSSGSFLPVMHPVVTAWGLSIATGATLELWTADLERLLWEVRAPAEWGRSPMVWNDEIVGGAVHGHLVGYNAIDGRPSLGVQVNGVVTGLAGSDGVMFVGTLQTA